MGHRAPAYRDRAVVRLGGEIDYRNTARVLGELRKAATRASILEIDLSNVTLITSDGAMIFFDLVRSAPSGLRVEISGATDAVRRRLSSLGVDHFVHYV
ncbi:STAS domain-containing protein [Yinghuangia sp. YIM S10712]|uniref:STAS domain-containing protein n=1 Tax=Yinghuangia sp. YIM S10712 TaxID=3436930 RepID=UPI003F53A8B2